ncbi:Glyoxylase, beta-lactamase superfamily II [Arthrobacter sp. ok909]|uniref:MBL fold metallo-hydrolase n=1 Tax=Arthrobacter sp. ok909 TaxID=1761746 RepID=UPI000883A056|nr:MBL fold metallo-hydrolase [Arthrobacter sp. ok909]SDP51731.1 Glyoxylase, beta-lactamase superfamily II [Arthrobacter sp. ok909]
MHAETDFTAGVPRPGDLEAAWIHGSESAKHNTDPDIQVHAYDEHTFILRQNMAVNYEAPFMFLLFGHARAVLIDTGATVSADFFPLRRIVDGLMDAWLAAHPRVGYQLLVLHTHPHGDHVAGDAQFAGRPDTVLVDAARDSAWEFFGFTDNPDGGGGSDGGDGESDGGGTVESAHVDLGGRVLECWPSPGHHNAAVTFYDRYTGFLLTGDTVYPGRLYIQDWPAFVRTIDRLIGFCSTRPVTHVLGCHIEMSREPGVDYPIYTTYQPDEPPLQMSVDDLREIRRAIDEAGGRPGRHVSPGFILCVEGE